MNGEAAPVFYQVSLTGERLHTTPDEPLLAALQSRFKLDADAARQLLGRAVTVKRYLDAATADRLVLALVEMGLAAVRQDMPTPVRVATKPSQIESTPQAPLPAPATPSSDAHVPSPTAGLRALAGQKLASPRTRSGYWLGLLVLTTLCLLLPALYLGLTLSLAYGWGWYLTHIHQHLPRNPYLVLMLYALPGLAGGVLLLFLLKPLFAVRPRPPVPVCLDPEQEPEFIAGIQALCSAIGTRPPAAIHLSAAVNASVHFQHGWGSLISGEKVLTIGLPLMAGMSAREFVGVLAHEFGHFAQRLGMRCSFIVNSVNAWFERCAYAPDSWDARLERWSEQYDDLRGTAANLTILLIGLTRLLMAGLFQLSFRMSQQMSRQMEFDADRYAALVAGSDCFRTSARKLRGLDHAMTEVDQANSTAWREGRLLRNVPEAVATQFSTFEPKRFEQIDAEMLAASTRYWDSHPADNERIDNAESQRAEGHFRDEQPAARLLTGFAAQCELVTLAYYRELGLRFQTAKLQSKEDILQHAQQRTAQTATTDRYFNGQFRPWTLLDLKPPPDTAQAAALGWQACIDALRRQSPEISRDWIAADEMEARSPQLKLALALDLSAAEVGLSGGESRPRHVMEDEYQRILQRSDPVHQRLRAAHQLYARRVDCALAALPTANREQAMALRALLVQLHTMDAQAGALTELHRVGQVLTEWATAANPDEAVIRELNTCRSRYFEHGLALLTKADGLAQTVANGGTVGAYLRSHCPRLLANTQDPAHFLREAAALPAAFQYFYQLCLGELLSHCEAAEQANGIRPIRLFVLVDKPP